MPPLDQMYMPDVLFCFLDEIFLSFTSKNGGYPSSPSRCSKITMWLIQKMNGQVHAISVIIAFSEGSGKSLCL